ncbi:MAG TPA: sporulation transcription factor Spo0A [Clostridiales bacterium]|nr:sporulation transcription factor Spo0A [Clostridiales bacterium]
MEKTAQSKGKIRIYIADKTEDNQLVSYIRENEKFSLVGSSTNGEDVLESVPLLKPDFLVMEVMLSGIDGFVVLEKLKESMGENMPKVIFVTNLSHTGFVTKAMNEGASYFMVKPVKPEVLAERIFDLMQSSSQQVSTMKVNKQLDEKISNIFISIGIPAHIKGYQFLREAVKLAVEKPEIIGSITKQLYPTIAERFETSSSKVERGMRHAIEVAWNRGKIENINSLFGLKIYNSNEKPTNGELIALIADKMIMEG